VSDNFFYKSVKAHEHLLQSKTRNCCTTRANRVIPQDVERKAEKMMKGE
jgi:hypothetical protein